MFSEHSLQACVVGKLMAMNLTCMALETKITCMIIRMFIYSSSTVLRYFFHTLVRQELELVLLQSGCGSFSNGCGL